MKFIKKCSKHLTSPFAVGLLVSAIFAYISFLYYENRHGISKESHSFFSLLQELHDKTFDWRLTDRGFVRGSDRVVILAIDEAAIEQEGRWPWPRNKVADLTAKALALGAKLVAFDAVFPEADENSSISSLNRMRRELLGKSQLTPDIEGLISTEIVRTDGDSDFAAKIEKHADHLIMGAYFDSAPHPLPAFQDFCTDALFERSAAARYWQSESQSLTISDEERKLIGFPQQMKERLTEYFMLLEVSTAASWFENRDELVGKITTALEDLSEILPPETYPGLATLWLNNDFESVQVLLEATNSEPSHEAAALLLSRFGSAFERKETVSLSAQVRKTGKEYCQRFLTERDELLNRTEYISRWGDSPEANENYAALEWKSLWPQVQLANESNGGALSFDDAIKRIRSYSTPNRIPEADRWWVNIPSLARATKHTGHFNSTLDSDGSIRRSMLVVRKGNSYAPSLALKTFLLDNGYNAVVKIGPHSAGRTFRGLEALEIRDTQGALVMTIPTSPDGYMMINYSGGRNMFPHVSGGEIMNDSDKMRIEQEVWDPNTSRWRFAFREVDKREFLKDKILIFGATAMGVYDLRVTPFEENYPGVETHANALSNLLIEHARLRGENVAIDAPGFLKIHPLEERFMWVLILGIGLVLSALLSYFGSLPGLGITAIFLGGVYAIDRFWLFQSGIVIAVIFPILGIFGTFFTLTFYKYFTEERKKRELKGTFEKYVSPSIVAEVLSDPENIELGGKKMDLTVMFSDVRGFTTISEKLDPRELSDLLNSYLTPMTDLVFKNKGTLDKYMGDAIMAFWGAPIHFHDHAKHACRCALQMLAKLKELQAEYRAKGLPEIDIGIGLNTGDMSVGNMGSETVRSYTVMGDSVNLGSRLEGINKEYGTRIIISEFTNEAVKDSFATREIDWVRVKGKAQPIRIFELIAEGSHVPNEMQATLEHFNTGFALYHQRKFQEAIQHFQEGLKHSPNDPPSQLYIERCEDYLQEPPPENWDGVYNMKTK